MVSRPFTTLNFFPSGCLGCQIKYPETHHKGQHLYEATNLPDLKIKKKNKT